MPQQVNHTVEHRFRSRFFGITIGLISILAVAGVIVADDGQYRQSPHGSVTDGVLRTNDLPRGSCAQCHLGHDVDNSFPYGLFTFNSNELCFSVSA